MRSRTFTALIACLLVAAPAALAGDGFKLGGTFGLGGQYVDTSSTVDDGKLLEYRDLTSGLLLSLDLEGRGRESWFALFGENLGREDMYVDLRGGSIGSLKFRVFSDSLEHTFATDARTPYGGAGTAMQTATLPNLNPNSWYLVDLAYSRRNEGAMAEFTFKSPWYVRADLSQVSFDGNKLQGYAQGTGSGNGFVDLVTPVDWTTTTYALEAGYSTRRAHFAVAYHDSWFKNDHEIVTWTNGYFGNNNPPATAAANGTDASYLPYDNQFKRLSFNGSISQLPWNSTLALRYTQSDSTSDVPLATSQLIGSATARATSPFLANPPVFAGEISYDSWAVSWTAAPSKAFDFRLYASDYERDNRSSDVIFSGFVTATNALGCIGVIGGTGPIGTSTGPRICENEPFSFERSTLGAELGWRPTAGNRFTALYDEQEVDREHHPDSTTTKERRYALGWRNSAFAAFGLELKVERLERDSNLIVSPVLPNTIWSYDVADMTRDLAKVALDFSPTSSQEYTVEYSYKKSEYDDSPAGRQQDDRDEIYVSAAFGERDGFRMKLYYDTESATSDYRLINRNSTTGLINYTVFTGVENTFEAIGAGFDWPVKENLSFAFAAVWNESEGLVDFEGLAGATALPTTLVDIRNFGNGELLALNLKADYTLSAKWGFTAGVAYEDFALDDIQYFPYSYTLPTAGLTTATLGTASYLTGYYSQPDYTATIAYFTLKYSF